MLLLWIGTGRIIIPVRLSVLFCVSYFIWVTVKLQVLLLFLCGIPPPFGRWFVQMENVLHISLSIGWNFPHSKKRTFPAVVIACLETKIWTSGWLLWESTSIVRYFSFFLLRAVFFSFFVLLGLCGLQLAHDSKYCVMFFYCCFARVRWC